MEYIKTIFAFFSGILAATIIEYLKLQLSLRRKNKIFKEEVENEVVNIKRGISIHGEVVFNNLYYDSHESRLKKDQNGDFLVSACPRKVSLYFLDRNIEELFVTASRNRQNILKVLHGCLEQLEASRRNIIDIDKEMIFSKENRAKKIFNMYDYIYDESIVLYILECYLSDKEVILMPEQGPKYMQKVCEENNICYEDITLAKNISQGWLKE